MFYNTFYSLQSIARVVVFCSDCQELPLANREGVLQVFTGPIVSITSITSLGQWDLSRPAIKYVRTTALHWGQTVPCDPVM
jgi:hypothetical protein